MCTLEMYSPINVGFSLYQTSRFVWHILLVRGGVVELPELESVHQKLVLMGIHLP